MKLWGLGRLTRWLLKSSTGFIKNVCDPLAFGEREVNDRLVPTNSIFVLKFCAYNGFKVDFGETQ